MLSRREGGTLVTSANASAGTLLPSVSVRPCPWGEIVESCSPISPRHTAGGLGSVLELPRGAPRACRRRSLRDIDPRSYAGQVPKVTLQLGPGSVPEDLENLEAALTAAGYDVAVNIEAREAEGVAAITVVVVAVETADRVTELVRGWRRDQGKRGEHPPSVQIVDEQRERIEKLDD
jgi:hypothetical protein